MSRGEVKRCECGQEPPCETRTFEDAGRQDSSGRKAAEDYRDELFDRGHFPDLQAPRKGSYRVVPGYVSAGGARYGQGANAGPGVIAR